MARQLPRLRRHCPNALPLAVQALEACQHLGDFAGLERYIDGLRQEEFQARDEEEFVDCLEELHLCFWTSMSSPRCCCGSRTRTTRSRRVSTARRWRGQVRRPGRLRIGYLSADLRNHVMGKMMWQAIAHHDRARLELLLLCELERARRVDGAVRGAGKRFTVIAGLDDARRRRCIADDDLDLLVDLSTHTRGARPGILARKPARVQITHIASAGSVGLSAIDYKLTDRYADVPENQEFQIERLLAMDGCVFPFRHVAPASQYPFDRRTLGSPPMRSSSARS